MRCGAPGDNYKVPNSAGKKRGPRICLLAGRGVGSGRNAEWGGNAECRMMNAESRAGMWRAGRMSGLLMRLSCVCVLVACVASVPARAEDAAPSTASELVRLFRFHAGAQAEALGEAAERAALDANLKEALRQLVRKHLARVEEEAPRAVAAAPPEQPLDELLDKAAKLARDFN